MDLADLSSIQNAVNDILSKGKKIDVLLNNAGVMATPKRMETAQGFELQFGTNHVGHHMLTRLLLPHMNDGGRIVTVASTAHAFGNIDVKDLNYNTKERSYSPWGAYGQSKLANILFAKGLNDRLQARNSDITCISLHPGVIRTNLWRYSPSIFQPFTRLIADKSMEQGAATSMFCCLADSSAFTGGDYIVDCKISTPNNNGQDLDETMRNALWDETEKMIAEAGYVLPDELV